MSASLPSFPLPCLTLPPLLTLPARKVFISIPTPIPKRIPALSCPCCPSPPSKAKPRISRWQAARNRFEDPLQLNQQASSPPMNKLLAPPQRRHRTSAANHRPPSSLSLTGLPTTCIIIHFTNSNCQPHTPPSTIQSFTAALPTKPVRTRQ